MTGPSLRSAPSRRVPRIARIARIARVARVLWLAGVATSALACSLIVSTSGLSDSSPSDPSDAQRVDATGDGPNAGEGGSGDGAPGEAATVDAGTDSSSPLSFCPDAALFCDDFDDVARSALSQGGWATGFGASSLTTDNPFSPPRAARVRSGSDAGPGRSVANVTLRFALVRTELTVSLRIRPHTGFQGAILELTLGNCVVLYGTGRV